MAHQNWLCFDNAGHAQTISDFSTAHRTRNTLAARLRLFFFEKIISVLNYFDLFTTFCPNNGKKKRKKNKWSQETCPPLKTTCRLSQCRETQEIKKGKRKTCFFLSDVCHFVFISFHVFSFFYFFHLFSFPAFLCHWKNHCQSRPLACWPTT